VNELKASANRLDVSWKPTALSPLGLGDLSCLRAAMPSSIKVCVYMTEINLEVDFVTAPTIGHFIYERLKVFTSFI